MSTCPISSLDNGTLLTVFDLITSRMPQWLDTETDRPLTVVRVASQVCQRWRELLLVSRWIWGRVIDLDVHGGQRKIEWLEEVSRRAGSAPLWIYGHVENPTDGSPWLSTQVFFVQLLQSWERIERLAVIIDSDDEKIINDIQNCFMCRSPILKSFNVDFRPIFIDTRCPGSSRVLFADYAPSLQTMESNQIAYEPNSPWLSNIREISSLPTNFNLNDIFVLLQHTPLIERFGIYEDMSWTDQVQSAFPKSILPNLSSMTVCASPVILTRILNHISPGRLSTLYFNIIDRGPPANDLAVRTSLTESLPLYVSNYFTSNLSTAVLFWMMDQALNFCDVSNGMDDRDRRKYKFVVAFRTIKTQHYPNGVVASLLDSFALAFTPLSLYRTITQIQIPHLKVQATVIPKLYSMLAVFRHVTCLLTNEQCSNALFALSCLDNADGDPQYVLFPSLKTLRLTSFDVNAPYNVDIEHQDLTPFIKRRKNIGFPVTKLDLTSCEHSSYAQDLRELEEVHGLEVVWKQRGVGSGESNRICSYICGTGDPEQLKGIL